jgi:hypothetical protein
LFSRKKQLTTANTAGTAKNFIVEIFAVSPWLYFLLNLQAFNHPPMYQMFLDDFFNVFLVDIRVPNGFGIDHKYRTIVAAIHATGLVDAYFALTLELEFADAILGVGLHLGGAQAVATGFTFGTLVAAEKNVMLEMAHATISLIERGVFCAEFYLDCPCFPACCRRICRHALESALCLRLRLHFSPATDSHEAHP